MNTHHEKILTTSAPASLWVDLVDFLISDSPKNLLVDFDVFLNLSNGIIHRLIPNFSNGMIYRSSRTFPMK